MLQAVWRPGLGVDSSADGGRGSSRTLGFLWVGTWGRRRGISSKISRDLSKISSLAVMSLGYL